MDYQLQKSSVGKTVLCDAKPLVIGTMSSHIQRDNCIINTKLPLHYPGFVAIASSRAPLKAGQI